MLEDGKTDKIKKTDSDAIDFAERFAGSAMFDKVFREGMGLVEETADYLDGPGRDESRDLDRKASLTYATASMRLTTRLMQVASWLLLQRAVKEGEMTQAQAGDERHRVRLEGIGRGERDEDLRQVPAALGELIERSFRIHERILRIDHQLRSPGYLATAEDNPVEDQIDRLKAAFSSQD